MGWQTDEDIGEVGGRASPLNQEKRPPGTGGEPGASDGTRGRSVLVVASTGTSTDTMQTLVLITLARKSHH